MGDLKHAFTSGVADGGDATLVRPSNWNAAHTLNGSAIGAGSSFPGSPASGDQFYRTDLNVGFVYDGTRWLSTTLYRLELPATANVITATGLLSHKTAGWGTAAGFSNLWLVDAFWAMNVGATNTGAAYWTLDVYKQLTAGGADASVAAGTTQSLTASQNHLIRTAIGALAGTNVVNFYAFATKVSTASNIQGAAALTYRLVAT